MQFRKKKKKQKNAEVDENLLKEQEKLFNDAKLLDFNEDEEFSPNPNMIAQGPPPAISPPSSSASSEKFLPPVVRTESIKELDKKLSEKPQSAIDAIDFDNLDKK